MGKNKKTTSISLSTVFSLISMVLFIVKTVNSFSEGAKAGGASGIIKFAVLPLIIVFAIRFFLRTTNTRRAILNGITSVITSRSLFCCSLF